MSAGSNDSLIQQRTPGAFRKVFIVAGNIFFGLLLFIIISMVFFLVQNKVTGGPPKVFGHYMYIVLSGSMAPTFDTGSVVFVQPKEPEEIKAGDVITYHGIDDKRTLATHRVVEVDRTDPQNIQFITKGDANEVVDPSPVSADRLVGTLSFSIPYLGYLLSFAQTKKGMLLLVILPGTFLIITELHKLYVEYKSGHEQPEKVHAGNVVNCHEADDVYEIVELKSVGEQEKGVQAQAKSTGETREEICPKPLSNAEEGETKELKEREEEFNRLFWA